MEGLDSETEDEDVLAEGDSAQLFQQRKDHNVQEGEPPAHPTPGGLSEQRHMITNQVSGRDSVGVEDSNGGLRNFNRHVE